MGKKKEPGYWSSSNGTSGGSWGVPSKAQQKKNRNQSSDGFPCLIILFAGLGVFAGLVTEAVRWLV